ncbi:MAG: glutamine amidotransferase [Candidatus Brocadiia bacterium]
MQETGLSFRPYLNVWILLALAVILLGLAVLAYRRTGRPVARRYRLLLLGLRCSAVLLLLVLLLRPGLDTVQYEIVKRPLLLLIDGSNSMTGISDTASGVTRRQAVEELLAESSDELADLRAAYDVLQIDFARGLIESDLPEQSPQRRSSAYGLALQQAAAEVAGGQADALVVFGDGSHNHGPPDPVEVAAGLGEQGIPVHTVGVGQDAATAQLRDVKLVEVTAPRSVPLFSRFPVRAEILCRGAQGQSVDLQLTYAGREVQTKTVRISHPEETVPLEFEVVPEEEGDFKLTVTATPLPDELLESNNAASAFVKVIREGLTVGYFDVLRPESKFLARAMTGAEQLQARRVLVLPGRKLPEPATEMDRYDVVVLGDVPPDAFLPSRILELKRRIQQEGKGLVVLMGPDAWRSDGWADTALADVLPVQLGASPRYVEGQRRWIVDERLADHPAVALEADPQQALRAWSQMPPVNGVFVGPTPRRGATVPATDADGNPLLVVHRSGQGRVACVLTDTTFRWFFTERETQDYHRRFWRQLLLWASGRAGEEETRVRLELNKRRLLLEEPLTLQVTVQEPDGQPVRDATVEVQVETPEGTTESLGPAFSRERGGYTDTYSPPIEGDYTVTAQARREQEVLGSDRALFRATGANPELEDPIADLKLLRRMSAATEGAGGRYYSYLQAGDLFRRLAEAGEPLKLTTRRRRDIWDDWPTFLLLAALLAGEWTLRKRKGLI